MIFLIFGVINLIAAIVMAIFAFMSPNPASFVSLITAILNCILFFGLYAMRKDVNRNEENISILQDSLNECREKLGLKILERESEDEQEEESEQDAFREDTAEEDFEEDAFREDTAEEDFEQDAFREDTAEENFEEDVDEDIFEDDRNIPNDNECPACFHKISPNDKECPNCGYKLK